MTAQKISAKNGTEETSPSAEVVYDFGDNLEDAVALFGADVVFSRFKAAAIVDLQALIRRHLDGETPKSQDEIQALVATLNEDGTIKEKVWAPGVTTRKRKSTKEKAEDLLSGLSPEERAKLLQDLLKAEDEAA